MESGITLQGMNRLCVRCREKIYIVYKASEYFAKRGHGTDETGIISRGGKALRQVVMKNSIVKSH